MSGIETARLWLRRWQDDDLERLIALYADPQVSRFLSHHGRPWPRERTVGVFEHFRRQWKEHGFGPWAVIDKATGHWLGQIGLNELPSWPGPQQVEVGWELDPAVWGRGLDVEANVVAAREVGIRTVWFQSTAQAISDLEACLTHAEPAGTTLRGQPGQA